MILRILIPLVVLLMLPAWGIDRLWWHRHVKGRKRWLVYTPLATLSLLLILTAANESYSMAADHWKGPLLSVTLTFLVPQALLALLLGLGQLANAAHRAFPMPSTSRLSSPPYSASPP